MMEWNSDGELGGREEGEGPYCSSVISFKSVVLCSSLLMEPTGLESRV